MKTALIKINSRSPEAPKIQKAVKILRKGGLVAFPTETVYGLGANALDKKAVRKIFKAKARPLDNPLIVHVASLKEVYALAAHVSEEAEKLMQKFWPGPLTLILPKAKVVPREVTAGSGTVALRMPNHRVALALIKAAGVPLAAPSANLAGKPSPTKAQHVFDDLAGKIDLILDGGRAKIGIESTVLDLTVKPARILRPGAVSLEDLQKVLPDLRQVGNSPGVQGGRVAKSPGMKYRHYSPNARLILARPKTAARNVQNVIQRYQKQDKVVGVLSLSETKKFYRSADAVLSAGSGKKPAEIARNLYAILRKFDKIQLRAGSPRVGKGAKNNLSLRKRGVDIILAESVTEEGIGFALMDRLKKAAKPAPREPRKESDVKGLKRVS